MYIHEHTIRKLIIDANVRAYAPERYFQLSTIILLGSKEFLVYKYTFVCTYPDMYVVVCTCKPCYGNNAQTRTCRQKCTHYAKIGRRRVHVVLSVKV
jgi:hypothetical protein